MSINDRLANFIDLLTFLSPVPPYWIEIETKNPNCTYYFGDFKHPLAAKLMQQGYIQDLIEEEAIVTSIKLKRCNPKKLTIVEPESHNDFNSCKSST